MTFSQTIRTSILAMLVMPALQAAAAPRLDLAGYAGEDGTITVLHKGDATDPYFAMQALLLAHDNGMDISLPAQKFVSWLVPYQKPDGTFDRFCRSDGGQWASCKVADADDSLLAMWMRLLETMPAQMDKNPLLAKSYSVSSKALEHLYQPSRGVYMVSPVYLHGLFMDNLEVWALKAKSRRSNAGEAARLARGIHSTFWQPVDKRFLVSTQLEQRAEKPVFYPDHAAQVFPLLVDFPLLPGSPNATYASWMKSYRAEWLRQSETDFPWGVIAVLAARKNDAASARCWLRQAGPLRHSSRWAVTDEVSMQIVLGRGLTAAPPEAVCT